MTRRSGGRRIAWTIERSKSRVSGREEEAETRKERVENEWPRWPDKWACVGAGEILMDSNREGGRKRRRGGDGSTFNLGESTRSAYVLLLPIFYHSSVRASGSENYGNFCVRSVPMR
ncbi:hypothetical protein V1477_004766 [Vespula maculifrons]|uniref:Uncharacterized protein n=1 Tax=Vespula maculifrons TaxID=7453 RepID=A0ABD2CMR1_VESMC